MSQPIIIMHICNSWNLPRTIIPTKPILKLVMHMKEGLMLWVENKITIFEWWAQTHFNLFEGNSLLEQN